jgi:hypothetical protein
MTMMRISWKEALRSVSQQSGENFFLLAFHTVIWYFIKA